MERTPVHTLDVSGHARKRIAEAVNTISAQINDAGYAHAIAAFNEFLFQLSRRDVTIGNPDAGAGKCSQPMNARLG